MKIGILSDSHGDAAETARAIVLLDSCGATKFVHCGDLCGMNVLDELAGRDAVFVWGNCDDPDSTMQRYVAALGLPWPAVPVTFTDAGKRCAVFHGHEREFNAAASSRKYDFIFYGHTHQFADDSKNGCRLINPGALHRAAIHTAAVLDTATGTLSIYDIRTSKPVM